MKRGNHEYNETLQLFIIVAATLGALLPSIYSLSHGVHDVFPFLYILPIILVVYFYPQHGVLYSLGMSIAYIGQIYYFGAGNPGLIAVSTAWFVIFITIGVVASSYANRLRAEEYKIRKVFENSPDGLFCFDRNTKQIREINPMCARMLRYERGDLVGRDIASIWPNGKDIEDFLSGIKGSGASFRREILLKARDGTLCRCIVSAILTSHNLVLCSAFDISNQKVADEEIRQTLEDLERQVRERTAHLEKINEELKAEILERRQFETTISPEKSGDQKPGRRQQ